MQLDWGKWAYGLVSGFIGGGAGSIGSGVGGIITDPEHFNPANGFRHLFVLMGVSFLFSGIITAAAYLKQSPLPQMREAWTPEQRAVYKSGAVATPKP